MMRRRAIVLLHDEDLHYLLALEPGEHVVTMWPDPMRDSIVIGIEGDETTDLPESAPGTEPYRIERPYAMAKLRERLREIVAEKWRPIMDSGETTKARDAYLRAVGEAVELGVFPHLGVTVPEPADGA